MGLAKMWKVCYMDDILKGVDDMAVVSVTFGAVNGDLAAFWASQGVSEIITISGSNQVSSNSGSGSNRNVMRVAAEAAIYLSIGAAPNATSDANRMYLPAGAVEYFPLSAGDKIAVVSG